MSYKLLLLFFWIVQALYTPVDIPTPDIRYLRDTVGYFGDLSVENGFAEKNEYIQVVIDDYRLWLPPYGALEKAGTDPQALASAVWTTYGPPPGWRSGTTRCMSKRGDPKQILFNIAWQSPNWYFYGTPMHIETAAHERAHIAQGCAAYLDSIELEWTAEIMGLEILASSERPEDYYALLAGVRELLLGTIIEVNGTLPEEVWGVLTEGERRFYTDEVNRWKNEEYAQKKSDSYYSGPLYRLLKDTDGIIYTNSNRQGYIVIDDLRYYLDLWFGKYRGNAHGRN